MSAYFLNTENEDMAYGYKVTGTHNIKWVGRNGYERIDGHRYNRLVKASTFMPHFEGNTDIEIIKIRYEDI